MMAASSTKSLKKTFSGVAPETICCYRHNDGDPFMLQKVNGTAESTTLEYTDLEIFLTKRVMRKRENSAPAAVPMKMFQHGSTKMQRRQEQRLRQQFFICPRRDVVFLKCCDMSSGHDIRTKLGIPEDRQFPQVEIVCYRAEECKKQQRQRMRRGPHSDWKRASFTLDHCKSENGANSGNDSTKLSWIDLRKFQSDNHNDEDVSLFSTEAGVVHFLRSILKPSHDASPWEAAATTSESRSKEERWKRQISSPDIVVLVLNSFSSRGYENDFSLLKNFRVSDAAPSWFLHGYVHLESLEESSDELFHQNFTPDYMDRPMTAPTSTSTLLIYKKLSPRRILSALDPALSNLDNKNRDFDSTNAETADEKTGEALSNHTVVVEKGCLWEEYETKNNHSHNQKGGGSHDEKIALSKDTNKNKKNCRYQLVSPPYLNLDEEYPGANLITKLFSREAIRIFTEDALSVPQWTPWPETTHYKVSTFGNEKPWNVFPLCHCFPANEPEKFSWVPVTKSFVPRTCRLLEEALGHGDGQSYLRTALFSQLAPCSVLEEHTGWADLANHVLRLHIPLVIPGNGGVTDNTDDLCGTWVDGCVETHAVGRPLLFDDSKTHRAFNYSDSDRIVLIVDLARPERLPNGTAESGHTEELDSFIQQMSLPK